MQTKVSVHRKAARPGPVSRTLAAVGSALATPVVKAYRAVARFTLRTLHTSAWFTGVGAASWGERDYAHLKASAFSNPFSWRAFTLTAFAFQSIRWRAYRRVEGRAHGGAAGSVTIELAEDHPFTALLRRPSPRVSFGRFVADLLDHLTFGGEVFAYAPESELTGRAAGRPGDQGLHLIRPDRVTRIEYEDAAETVPRRYHVRQRDGSVKPVLAERVRHFYLFEHPGRPGRGWPLAAAAARAVELMRGGEDWQKGIYDRKGVHPGFFKVDTAGGTMDDATFKRNKEELVEAYMEDRDAGRPGMLENIDFVPNGMTVRDADAVRVEQQAARRVAVGYGVMTPLLGDADNMTYDNLRTSLRALLNHTVLPILDWLLTEFTEAYMPMYEGESNVYRGAYLDYNRDEIEGLEEDKSEAYARAREAAGRPIQTVNESREMVGMSRTKNPEDDLLFAPVGVVPVGGDPFGLGEPDDASKAASVSLAKAWRDGHGSDVEDLVVRLTQPTE